jgi:uncharacterized protein (DUF433 family)
MNSKYIESTPDVCSGAPRIKGRRITIFNVISALFYGSTINEYSEEYEVEVDAILEAIEYCKLQKCKNSNVYQYCSGCILRTFNEESNFNAEDYYEVTDEEGYSITLKKDGTEIFLGTKEELIENEFGYLGWVRAETVFEKYFSNDSNS